MLRNAKLDLLRRVHLFSGCSKRESNEIARIADEIDFPAGKTLITQGRPGKQFFIVIEGAVDVIKNGEKLPELRGGSEFFGEISLVSGAPATATVTTAAPTRALVIAPQHFQALLDQFPSIQRPRADVVQRTTRPAPDLDGSGNQPPAPDTRARPRV